MASHLLTRPIALRLPGPETRHRMRLWTAVAALAGLILYVGWRGMAYYPLPLTERLHSPLHAALKPSGTIGLKLGLLGLAMFLVLFAYPIRKRSQRLSRIGKTKHWLEFHIVAGISAPLLITLHSSFKFAGLAGLAYWIMIAVAVSGLIGRYLYAQIPRSLSATELTIKEAEQLAAGLSQRLAEQSVFSAEELAAVFRLPERSEVEAMALPRVVAAMVALDLVRSMHMSRLRRKVLSPWQRVATLGGLLPSSNCELEEIVGAVRRQAWLKAKLLFLERAHRVFHLWHVVHRPFSYSFAVLIAVHITVVVLLGYYE